MEMINVGIIGSSYSAGSARLEPKLLDIFKEYNYNKKIKFYSQATPGHGSEHYLSDVIYLKQKYDIKILLVEIIENRAEKNIKNNFEHYDEVLKKSNYDHDLFITLYKSDIQSIYDTIITNTLREHIQAIIFFTIHDIIQTLNLCNLLNINPIVWCYRLDIEENMERINKINLPIKQFDKFNTVFERFFKKYKGNEKLFLDDSTHLNTNANIELVKDFLLPKIYECLDTL